MTRVSRYESSSGDEATRPDQIGDPLTAMHGALGVPEASTLAADGMAALGLQEARTLAEDGIIDKQLAEAAISAVELGTVTPLVKMELRLTIQSKRLLHGKEELQPAEQEERQPEQLTDEEMHKRLLRRARNRIAAQKCRNKRRKRSMELDEEKSQLESANKQLRREVDQLEMEKEMLEDMMKSHDNRANILGGCARKLSDSAAEDNVMLLDDI